MKKTTLLLLFLLSFSVAVNASNSSATSVNEANAAVTYEAETGKTYKGADVQDCTGCSGVKHVGNLGGPSANSGYLVSTVNVAKKGTYKMVLSFTSGDPRAIFISSNGQMPIETTLNSGAWDVVSTKIIEVKLNAGTNSIKFYNNNNYAPNIDKFTLELQTEDAPCTTCIGPFEAESGVITGEAKLQDCETCSNGKQVGDMGYTDRYFTKVVSIPAAGTYRIFVSYSSGTDRTLSITANETTTVSAVCNSIDWGVVFVKAFDIALQVGNNTLRFHGPNGDWAPNVDKFSLDFLSGLSLKDNQLNTFMVYPNPTKSTWNVKSQNAAISEIAVYDVSGRKVISQKPNATESSIDASNLKSGFYFTKVVSEEGVQTLQLIKE